MKNYFLVSLLSAMLFFSCDEQQLKPDKSQKLDQLSLTGNVNSAKNFRTHLSGDNEVPPVDTKAQGQAIFQLSDDGTQLKYKLIVANIENVLQSHIHCGGEGVNGPVVVFLYPPAPPAVLIPGKTNGILAEGVITQANIIPRDSSEACSGGIATMEDLLAKIRSGEAYVNVHTTQFPGGEIRGQF